MLVGSSTEAVGLLKDAGLLSVVVGLDVVLLDGAESHGVDAVGVVKEGVVGGISFNVLPAVSLPSAGHELHRAVNLLVGVGAVEVVAVEAVVGRVEVLGGNRVAVTGADVFVSLRVGFAVNWNFLHLLGLGLLGVSDTPEFTAGAGCSASGSQLLFGRLLETGGEDLLLTLGLLGKNLVFGVVLSCFGHLRIAKSIIKFYFNS
jgi:hypothetical protein